MPVRYIVAFLELKKIRLPVFMSSVRYFINLAFNMLLIFQIFIQYWNFMCMLLLEHSLQFYSRVELEILWISLIYRSFCTLLLHSIDLKRNEERFLKLQDRLMILLQLTAQHRRKKYENFIWAVIVSVEICSSVLRFTVPESN